MSGLPTFKVAGVQAVVTQVDGCFPSPPAYGWEAQPARLTVTIDFKMPQHAGLYHKAERAIFRWIRSGDVHNSGFDAAIRLFWQGICRQRAENSLLHARVYLSEQLHLAEAKALPDATGAGCLWADKEIDRYRKQEQIAREEAARHLAWADEA